MSTFSSQRVDSFFREQSQFGRYRIPTALVILAGIALGLQSVAAYYGLDSFGTEISNALTVSFVIDFFHPFALWFVFTIVFYLLAKLLGARTRTGRMFKLLGWGFGPFVLYGLLRTAGIYYAIGDATTPESVRTGVISAEQEAYQALLDQTAGDPILVGTTVVGFLFLLCSGYLWVLAVEYSTDLERRRAGIVVGLPLLAYLVYVLFQIV